MSGGSMNYIYSRLETDAKFIQNTVERRAFAEHLKLVVRALQYIELVDSGDYAEAYESGAIRACLVPETVLDSALKAAQEAHKALGAELDRCRSRQ